MILYGYNDEIENNEMLIDTTDEETTDEETTDEETTDEEKR